MTLTMSAQLDWRFRHLQTWSFKLVQMVDPLCPSTQAIAQAFWDEPRCCKEADMSRKVQEIFADAAAMHEDTEFQWLLQNWNRAFRATNMHIERLLAQVRCSVGGPRSRAPDAEILGGAGFLAQWLREHRAAWG